MYEKRKAVRTGRAAARPARVALAHATGVLLAIVAVLSLCSVKAYALPWQEKDGYPLGNVLMNENIGSNRGTAVYGAANEFFATLCIIGRKSDYLQLSNDQLSELSGEGTGGAFYELSQRWSNYGSDGAPVDWPIGISLAIQGQGLISDPAYIWYADYSYYESDSLYQRALADYLTIYNGGHLGGGGSSDPFVLSCNVKPSSYTTTQNPDVYYAGTLGGVFYRVMTLNVNGVIYSAVMPDIKIAFTDSQVSQLLASGCKLYVVAQPYVTGRTPTFSGIDVEAYVTDIEPVVTDLSYSSAGQTVSRIRYSWTPDGVHTIYSLSGRITSASGDTFVLTRTGNNISNGSSTVYLTNPRDGITSDMNNWANFGIAGGGGGGGGGGTWPEPDPTPQPDPPDVPEPEEPTGPGIDPPNPIGYTIDPTDDPDPVTDPYVVVVAPDSQDIIPWLRAILQAINNLGDKLNDESTELQRALNDVFFGNLSKLLKNIKGEFLQDFTQWLDLELEWMMESIESLFLDLQDYLHDLFEWLADQMNFEFDVSTDPYDDTSLLNWLRRIYNKLGADGGPNTRPVDPSTDPEGFLDWLRRMIQEFILGLGASASDLVSDIGDLLSRLFAKFPFSVPWDILAILGMLDAPPVAPHIQFSIPVPLGADSFNWSVDIDMQVWSTYIEAVRTVILLSFISWLAWLTPQVLRDLDPGDFL